MQQAMVPSEGAGYVVHEGCDHIFFVGFLGAGKSTLARNLGQMFHRSYLDTDRLVERRCQKNICDIFEQEGEGSFRQSEYEALLSLRERKSLLVSCGGGVVESPESCAAMHEMGVVVYLDGSLDDSLRQIQHPERRPDLGSIAHAQTVYNRRRPLYQKTADFVIDIRNKSFDEVASEAAQLLWEEGLL